MIVYLARDIPAFVMYCVNGESGSSLLIESTDSMIVIIYSVDSIVEMTQVIAAIQYKILEYLKPGIRTFKHSKQHHHYLRVISYPVSLITML